MSTKLSRQDVLILLASMGIPLPETTKISDEDLDKRLEHAFDAAQRMKAIIESGHITPTDYPIWPADKDLAIASQKTNYREAIKFRIDPASLMEVSSKKEDTLQELRKAVMNLAMGLKTTSNFCMVNKIGDLTNWGIYIRVTNVYCIKDAPIFVLLYKELAPDDNGTIEGPLRRFIEDGTLLNTIQSTDFERSTMLKLFRLNAKRLKPNFYPPGETNSRKIGLKTTFVLPLGPIGVQDLGKLTTNTGCEVCGKTKISRCVQCLSVAYCGTDCQKLDWPNHKSTCRSLKGGTWKTLTFEVLNAVILNKRDTIDDSRAQCNRPEGVPPDIHDGKVFLVKFQISLFQFKDEAHMVMYDRQRSFQGLWKRCKEQDLFDEAEESMGDELRMYRWARRVSDFQLSVCFDRAPAKNPPW